MRRLTIAVFCATWLVAACGAQKKPSHASAPSAPAAPTAIVTTAPASQARAPRRHHHHHHRRRPDPGRLPQSAKLPSTHTRAFHAEMTDLWRGISQGKLKPALAAFFPEAAYVQVKAIGDPQADWKSRLVGDYSADIAAAHALLRAHAGRARLGSVQVPAGYAHWVSPDACYNRIGYWETPNSRLVYRQAGRVRSLGIASLISWRGVWYVVHLGAVTRTGSAGVVDDPSSGPGYSAPSSTC